MSARAVHIPFRADRLRAARGNNFHQARMKLRSVAGAKCVSLLSNAVGAVLRIRSKPEMVGPDAWRVVARVADKQTGRDRAVGGLVGKAVSAH